MKNNKGNGWVMFVVIVAVFSLPILAVSLNWITIPFLKFGSQVQMNRDIVTKTYNADNALYNYHWFKEQAGAIEATEKNINNAEKAQAEFRSSAGVRSSWTFEDKTEDARLGAVSLGLKNYYNELVANYNARAKEADRSIFSQDLPLFFNLNAY